MDATVNNASDDHGPGTISDVIAEQQFIMTRNGQRSLVTIQIGRPYTARLIARCPVAAWGLWGRGADIAGASTLQALALALHFLSEMLPSWASAASACFYSVEDDNREISPDEMLTFLPQ